MTTILNPLTKRTLKNLAKLVKLLLAAEIGTKTILILYKIVYIIMIYAVPKMIKIGIHISENLLDYIIQKKQKK